MLTRPATLPPCSAEACATLTRNSRMASCGISACCWPELVDQFDAPSRKYAFIWLLMPPAPMLACERRTCVLSMFVPGQQQHEARRLAVGHRQRVDLLLRDHLRDLGARHLDDRRLARHGDGLLQVLQLHLEVLPQLRADRDRETIDVNGRKALQLGLQLVGAGLKSGETVLAVAFAHRGSDGAGFGVAECQRHAGKHGALRVGHGALNLADDLCVRGQRECQPAPRHQSRGDRSSTRRKPCKHPALSFDQTGDRGNRENARTLRH